MRSPIARALRAPLLSIPWIVPTVLLAWPAIDLPFALALALPITGAMLLALVADPISSQLEDGEDAASERRISYALLLLFVLSGLDRGRLFIGGPLSPETRAIGAVALFLAYLLRAAALATNPFFAGRLVVQRERGHGVIAHGPYAVVRHPGNLSAILIVAALPFELGTLLGVPAALLGIAIVLNRTIKEDRFLSANLPGYSDYAAKVRSRLIPGLY
jgi:protein-S-isoprenylcysteine O-methyltransferase Ste14